GMELDGDGSVGTDDNVEFYVLPGDTANLQTVTITEARAVVLSAGLSVGDASYNYRQDLTGQGTIVVTASRQIVPLSGTAVDLLDDPTAPQHSTGNLVTGDDMVTDDDISAASANAPITPATPLSVTTTVTDLSANEERAAKSDAIALGSITPVAKLAAVAIAGADSSLAATSTPPPLSAATMVAGPLPQSSQHIRHLDLALTLRGTAEAMTPTAPRVNSPLKH
ncbi:MAG TPA: hypothetical protein VHZ24_06870, partial [Pirellulales bacterium]|nr:hypothetical protein [Pirellulales bacterium]